MSYVSRLFHGLAHGVQMSWLSRFFRSTVGAKIVMGVTGLILYGFVIFHMAGNLQAWEAAEKLDAYGKMLKQVTEVLWGVRIGLLVAFAAHVWSAIRLVSLSRAARPDGYRKKTHLAANFASLTMKFTGPILLVFIVYHLLHFTVGSAHPDFQHEGVYHNVVVGFSNPLVAGFYILSMLCLAPHLAHGGYSMLRSLGLESEGWSRVARLASRAFALLVVIGNISIPLGVLVGFIHE